jgi:probable F420-dependent oxidoreductase
MLEYPLRSDAEGGAWIKPENMAEFARVAEDAGVDGIALTDHPAPSKKWLERGGHETLDPFVGLGFFAAATKRIRLMTNLTVVPYRNPILTAKSMAAVDVVSGGRATFVLGTGYLRSEFAALGVDIEERNELFDEAVEVMKGVWSDDDFRYEGKHFQAFGVTMRPNVVQRPHPPLWVGGNAKISRRRVATWGDGWHPLMGSAAFVSSFRTRAIETDDQLFTMIREIKDMMAENGRDASVLDVSARSTEPLPPSPSVDQQLDQIGRLAENGVTWTSFPFGGATFAEALDSIRHYGNEVAAKAR